jgi:hypothetical protein
MGAHAVSLGDRLLRPRRLRRFIRTLPDGLATTVHVATYPRRTTRVRVVALEPAESLRGWSRRTGVAEAIAGGFHYGSRVNPLGELWTGGDAHMHVPVDPPWDMCRSCIAVSGDHIEIGPRGALPSRPSGDLLQAGPLLVLAGRALIGDRDPEGFGAAAHQLDCDIATGRHPRAAFGISRDRLIAAVCDGRSMRDAGMTLGELAQLMVDLGADTAINLAGGGSASLVCGGHLQNRPRESSGVALLGGRPVASVLVLGR